MGPPDSVAAVRYTFTRTHVSTTPEGDGHEFEGESGKLMSSVMSLLKPLPSVMFGWEVENPVRLADDASGRARSCEVRRRVVRERDRPRESRRVRGILRQSAARPHGTVIDAEGAERHQPDDCDRNMHQHGAPLAAPLLRQGHRTSHIAPTLHVHRAGFHVHCAGDLGSVPTGGPSDGGTGGAAAPVPPAGETVSGVVGSGGTSSGSSGRTSRGVINTISSVCSARSALLLKSAPMIGRLLRIGIAALILLGDVVQEAGDGERLPIPQFDIGFRTARGQRRNAEAAQGDAVREIERADLWSNFQPNHVASNRRLEAQPDAELLEQHGDVSGGP